MSAKVQNGSTRTKLVVGYHAYSSHLNSFIFIRLRTLCALCSYRKSQPLCFQVNPHSCTKTPGVGYRLYLSARASWTLKKSGVATETQRHREKLGNGKGPGNVRRRGVRITGRRSWLRLDPAGEPLEFTSWENLAGGVRGDNWSKCRFRYRWPRFRDGVCEDFASVFLRTRGYFCLRPVAERREHGRIAVSTWSRRTPASPPKPQKKTDAQKALWQAEGKQRGAGGYGDVFLAVDGIGHR